MNIIAFVELSLSGRHITSVARSRSHHHKRPSIRSINQARHELTERIKAQLEKVSEDYRKNGNNDHALVFDRSENKIVFAAILPYSLRSEDEYELVDIDDSLDSTDKKAGQKEKGSTILHLYSRAINGIPSQMESPVYRYYSVHRILSSIQNIKYVLYLPIDVTKHYTKMYYIRKGSSPVFEFVDSHDMDFEFIPELKALKQQESMVNKLIYRVDMRNFFADSDFYYRLYSIKIKSSFAGSAYDIKVTEHSLRPMMTLVKGKPIMEIEEIKDIVFEKEKLRHVSQIPREYRDLYRDAVDKYKAYRFCQEEISPEVSSGQSRSWTYEECFGEDRIWSCPVPTRPENSITVSETITAETLARWNNLSLIQPTRIHGVI